MMDNYTKYGLLAAGAIGLYIASKKGALGDDVRDDSYEDLKRNDPSLMGLKKRRKGKNKSSKKHSAKALKEDFAQMTADKQKLMIWMSDILGYLLDIEEEVEGIKNERLHYKIENQKEALHRVTKFLVDTYK